MKLSRSTRAFGAVKGSSPRALVLALAQAGLLATTFSLPVCAATVVSPVRAVSSVEAAPLLYIAQVNTPYGTLSGGSGTGTTPSQSGGSSGSSTTPSRPQGSSSPAPKPAPAPDSRNSSR